MRTDTSVNGGQPFYYQQDRNFNVTDLTNASGTIIEKYKYDAFAAPTFYDGASTELSASAFNNRFLFTGREYAATFGFYEYRARAYNPVLGRFMSEDPKGFDAGDYNLFRYCHNDPLDFTDPMGLGDESVNAKIVQTEAVVNLAMDSRTVLPIGSNIPVLAVQLPNAQWVDYRAAAAASIGQTSKLAKGNPEASQLRPIDPSRPRSMKEFIIAGNMIEHGNTMDTTPLVDPISLASGIFAARTALTVVASAAATRAMWVGKDGLEAAQASGASLLRPSQAALNAMRAGDMSLMQAESAAWARGATGRVPVFFGNGAGRTFLNHELPQLLKNMNSGKVTGIDITF
jgi:RHS repeat-associated protein